MRHDWRQGLLYLTVMGMEGATLYAVLAVFNRQIAEDRLAVLGLMLLYPLAFAVNKILHWWKLRPLINYPLNILAWSAAVLLAAKAQLLGYIGIFDNTWLSAYLANFWGKAELIIFFSSIALWFTGRRLARISIDFATAVGEFQFTMAILLLTLFTTSQLHTEVPDGIALIIIFAVSSLVAMSLSHAREGRGWLSGLSQGHWVTLLIVSIGLILVLGLLVSAMLTPDFLQVVINALKWAWDKIMMAITYLLSLLPTPEGEPVPLPAPDTAADNATQQAIRELIPESIREPLRIAWLILASGAMLAALWRISTQLADWLRRRLADRSRGEIESLNGAFFADLLDFFKRVLAKLFGGRWFAPRQSAPENIHPARQIYRQFLKWTAKRGFPRPTFQTPYEYLAALRELIPASDAELNFITQQYVNIRYGMAPPSEADLDRLRETWRQVQKENSKITKQA
ncbi:MAG: DUF4129 domain-containing protein [Dehalococcoidales bacterium]|nr:DUF4129 domain-containing protein [Dehalococcoidales bacterium]